MAILLIRGRGALNILTEKAYVWIHSESIFINFSFVQRWVKPFSPPLHFLVINWMHLSSSAHSIYGHCSAGPSPQSQLQHDEYPSLHSGCSAQGGFGSAGSTRTPLSPKYGRRHPHKRIQTSHLRYCCTPQPPDHHLIIVSGSEIGWMHRTRASAIFFHSAPVLNIVLIEYYSICEVF